MPDNGNGITKFKEMYNDYIYTPASYLGFTFLPEIICHKELHNLSDVIGSGIWTFGLLMSTQLFGLQGATIHSLIYGGAWAVHGTFCVIDSTTK
jgi:hypothetical protein